MRLLTSSPYGALNRIFELVGDPPFAWRRVSCEVWWYFSGASRERVGRGHQRVRSADLGCAVRDCREFPGRG